MIKQRISRIGQKPQDGFTIVELMVVVAVIAILATVVYFSIGSWRLRTAQTEVKSDLSGLQTAMENARNFSNGYPVYPVGTVFNTTLTKDVFVQSSNVTLTYRSGDSTTYCVDAQSTVISSARLYLNTAGGNKI